MFGLFAESVSALLEVNETLLTRFSSYANDDYSATELTFSLAAVARVSNVQLKNGLSATALGANVANIAIDRIPGAQTLHSG